MLNLLTNVAIQDTTNTANIVYLDNIMTGVDGAATFGYSVTPTALQVTDNQRQQYKHDHQLDIRVLRASGADLTKLQAMDGKRVNVAGYTPDGVFIWGGTPTVSKPILTYKPQFDEVIADQILLTETTPIGYVFGEAGYELPVHAGDNLMSKYEVATFDYGGGIYLSGFIRDTGINGIDGSGNIVLGDGQTIVSDYIYFPFPGLAMQMGVKQLNAGSPGDVIEVDFIIRFRNAAGSQISTSTFTAGPGIDDVKHDFVLPTGTAYIELEISNTSDDEAYLDDMYISYNRSEYSRF
jgi:hypothetical protein